MEILPGITVDITLSLVVGWMIKILMILLLLLSVIMVRQEALMNKVVNLPLGKNLRVLVWVFFLITLILTTIVVIA